MPSPTSGLCLICGQSTEKSCEECAKAAFGLFFCSPEHQSLVWCCHKDAGSTKECGNTAVRWERFCFPFLSPEERDEALARVDEGYIEGDGLTTLAMVLDGATKLSSKGGGQSSPAAVVRLLTSYSFEFPLGFAAFLLATVRHALHCLRSSDLQQPDLLPATELDLHLQTIQPPTILSAASLAFHRQLAQSTSTDFWGYYPTDKEWYSTFFHQLEIFASLNYTAVRASATEQHPQGNPGDVAHRRLLLAPSLKAMLELSGSCVYATAEERKALQAAVKEVVNRTGVSFAL